MPAFCCTIHVVFCLLSASIFSVYGSCYSNPCENNGDCINAVYGYICQCTPCYYGITCTIMRQNPPICPCFNGGVCRCHYSAQEIHFSCHCRPGYSGLRCKDIDYPCNSNPCYNGGTCRNENTWSGHEYSCFCRNRYSGNRCQDFDDPCDSNPCYNGGTCRYEQTGSHYVYECSCRYGYSGTRCQDFDNPCNSNPCYNGGTCRYEQIGSHYVYECSCRYGYSGTRCQGLHNPCNSNPCYNSGTCRYEQRGSHHVYHCSCLDEYSGNRCQDGPCNIEVSGSDNQGAKHGIYSLRSSTYCAGRPVFQKSSGRNVQYLFYYRGSVRSVWLIGPSICEDLGGLRVVDPLESPISPGNYWEEYNGSRWVKSSVVVRCS